MYHAKKLLAIFAAAALVLSGWPAAGSAAAAVQKPAEMGTKPADGTTNKQPFPSGTGGSANFRIPGLVTLNDGTLVAACDARWNHAGDACGLDTIVSRSTDNGATWKYTFANYLGDYGNKYAANASAFIDPAIATDGTDVYLIADIYPGGYAINTAPNKPITGNEFFKKDCPLLARAGEGSNDASASSHSAWAYNYYLEKKADATENDYYAIKKKADGTVVSGYTIDAYFNITGPDSSGAIVSSSLFFWESPFVIYPTDYLYFTKSADGGATWSVPKLLNMKKPAEQTLLVGPGRGIVTSTGRIVFTAYEWTGSDRNSACFYSDDGGETWTRGASVPQTSSEAAVVEADDKLYMFTRHGGYNVSEDWGATWSAKKEPGITYNLGCELSAITYSKKINGKTAILFSAPSSTGSRSAGKIFVGLVQADGTISWDYNYSVNGSAYYAYSCLTELKDGSIGLLYENGGAAITYVNIPLEKVAKNAMVGVWSKNAGRVTNRVTIAPKASVTLTAHSAVTDAEFTAQTSDENAIGVQMDGTDLVITGKDIASGGFARGYVTLSDGTDTATITVDVTDVADYETVELRMGETHEISGYTNETFAETDRTVAVPETAVGKVTIRAVEEGQTKAIIADKPYFILVKNDVRTKKLPIGESFVLAGESFLRNPNPAIVSVMDNPNPTAPYEKISGVIEDGKYLIGTNSHIVTNADSVDDNPRGRKMQAANFLEDNLSDYAWTVTKASDGYSFQDKDGKYLYFDGANVLTREEESKVAVASHANGSYSISSNSRYLNNFSNANVRAAGWTADNNDWYFYRPAPSKKITALKTGKTNLVLEGTTYEIIVPLSQAAEDAYERLNTKLSEAKALVSQAKQEGKYTTESVSRLENACNRAQGFYDKKEQDDPEEINRELERLTDVMTLDLIAPAPGPGTGGDQTGGGQTDGTDQTGSQNGGQAGNNNQNNQNNQNQQQTQIPAVGSSQEDDKGEYIVLTADASGGTTSYSKPAQANVKTLEVPNTIKVGDKTYKVTEVADNALKGNTKVKQVTIGENITRIGKNAFAKCKNLKIVKFTGSTVPSIAKNAFKGAGVKKVIVPKQLRKNKAFLKAIKAAGIKVNKLS